MAYAGAGLTLGAEQYPHSGVSREGMVWRACPRFYFDIYDGDGSARRQTATQAGIDPESQITDDPIPF